ncbi:MAG: hypothetical protein APR56_09965 [Methanosaeta sp. SDB]|nr:MAG: hypothetical protein APR56_09965 [Methanosaeta sp. SDB]
MLARRKEQTVPAGGGRGRAPLLFRVGVSTVPALLILLVLIVSCSHYQLGTTLPPHLRTVYIPTFENKTYQPGIEADVTDAVITRFRQDGNLQPVGEDQADTVVSGEITDWNRRVLGYTGRDEDNVEEYRLYVTATISFRERGTGRYLIRRQKIRGYTDFYLEGDLPSAEEAARPRAYQDLARNIVDVVVSIW